MTEGAGGRARTRNPAILLAFALSAPLALAQDAAAEPEIRPGLSVLHTSAAVFAFGAGVLSYGSATELDAAAEFRSGAASARFSGSMGILGGTKAQAAWAQAAAAAAAADPNAPYFPPAAFLAPAWSEGTPAPGVLLALGLREASVKLAFGPFSAEAGRMPVKFGVARTFSPADIFSAYDVSGALPRRIPSDIVRLAAYPSALSSIEFVAAPFAAPGGKYALRGYAFLADALTVAASAGRTGLQGGSGGSWSAALEAKVDLPWASPYAEAACFIADGSAPADGEWKVVAGADASIAGALVYAEYLFDGRTAAGEGRHRLSGSIARQFGEWTSGSAGLDWSPDSGRLSAAIALALENVAGAGLTIGAGALRSPDAGWALSLAATVLMAF